MFLASWYDISNTAYAPVQLLSSEGVQRSKGGVKDSLQG